MGYRKNFASPRWWKALQCYSILVLLLASVSCTNTKRAAYFSDQKNGSFAAPAIPKLVIQNNDLLSISVSSLNPEASAIFNQPNNTPANNNQRQRPHRLRLSGGWRRQCFIPFFRSGKSFRFIKG